MRVKEQSLLLLIFSKSARALVIPVAFDVVLSIYTGKVGLYAPFLYPMFLIFGVIEALYRWRRRAH
jgi:hypothetical protein